MAVRSWQRALARGPVRQPVQQPWDVLQHETKVKTQL